MLTIAHSAGSYAVCYNSLTDIVERLPDRSVILTDGNVSALYGGLFSRFPSIVVEPGEKSKGIDTYTRVVAQLAEMGLNRKATLVALGGGVIGDLGGFVAATYMRGIRFIQIPTTLLAQVDSSVGGKVGVDLPQGKNLIGAFLPPEAVYVPVEALTTLPEREFVSGMAEVCKYGFIMDAPFVEDLNQGRLDPCDMAASVDRCIRHKAYVVSEDEFETKGLRAILNFGHTIGHAIEQVTGYGPILHGEAIAVGMRVEAELAEKLGLAEPGLAKDVCTCLEMQGLRVRLGLLLDKGKLLEAMRRDKKRSEEGLPFSLVTQMGRCKLYTGIAESEVEPLLHDL